jgi:hypothetical protein
MRISVASYHQLTDLAPIAACVRHPCRHLPNLAKPAEGRKIHTRIGIEGRIMSKRALAVLAALLWVPSQSYALDSATQRAYAEVSLKLPTTASVVVCHGFGCTRRTEIGLSGADRARLTALLAAGRASVEAERRAIATAVVWFDRRVGPQAGTTHRVARAGVLTKTGPGQMDCIDTSRNTTSLFLILDQLRLLRHHQVGSPVAPGYLLDGRGLHATAVLRETRSGKKWAVDNWTRNYGERPDVMPLEQWMAER